MTKPLIVANWKMNPTAPREAAALAAALTRGLRSVRGVRVVICPPFPFLCQSPIANRQSPNVALGAQDCFWEQKGPYTGEVSPSQLFALGCRYVILGHSERKRELGETLGQIAKKVRAALQAGLAPVVCLGERKRGDAGHRRLLSQARAVLGPVPQQHASRLVAVYEPEWAISSRRGARPASPKEIRSAVEALRGQLQPMFGSKAAARIPVLYGGSTNAGNIRGILGEGKADGALVGGASLKAGEFARLVKRAEVR